MYMHYVDNARCVCMLLLVFNTKFDPINFLLVHWSGSDQQISDKNISEHMQSLSSSW